MCETDRQGSRYAPVQLRVIYHKSSYPSKKRTFETLENHECFKDNFATPSTIRKENSPCSYGKGKMAEKANYFTGVSRCCVVLRESTEGW